eukprot:TRINITY_DN45667_c0_g1_i1.p1 TRINITY_DN45667_c0_g1~~TRINITY_DN45667_c0_g1_i1.p1  ORF type:complete len:322 (-),score=62.76 TRINITY_DN45667_c0_g1_i1:50-931(-)
MVASVVGSLRSLAWALVLYFMLLYSTGVYFTQAITQERVSRYETHEEDSLGSQQLLSRCGSLWSTILTLWTCITGGADWNDLVQLFMHEISAWLGIQLVCFITFCILAMANVITGIFVETAVTTAQQDKDVYVAKKVADVFKENTSGGHIDRQDFLNMAQSDKLADLFRAVNVDVKDAPTIFKILDLDDNGSVDPIELLDGWLRLRGPAKSMDLALLMREHEEHFRFVRGALREMREEQQQLLLTPAPESSQQVGPQQTLCGRKASLWIEREYVHITRNASLRAKELMANFED